MVVISPYREEYSFLQIYGRDPLCCFKEVAEHLMKISSN